MRVTFFQYGYKCQYTPQKQTNMKKIVSVLALAVVFAACGNNGDSTESVQDSVIETIDSAADARVDSIQETTDSVKDRLEDTFEKTDSANAAIADSATNK